MAFITNYCRIRNQSITLHDELKYTGQSEHAADFLDKALLELSISYPKFHKMDLLSKAGFLAAEMILRDGRLMQDFGPQQVAVVLSNAHASLDVDLRYFETMKTIASPALFVYTLANIVTGEICIRHGIKGENAFFVSAAFDSNQMCNYVNVVLSASKTQACLAGWVDVMGDQVDVLLYLVENREYGAKLDHNPAQLDKLYHLDYGTVDGRS